MQIDDDTRAGAADEENPDDLPIDGGEPTKAEAEQAKALEDSADNADGGKNGGATGGADVDADAAAATADVPAGEGEDPAPAHEPTPAPVPALAPASHVDGRPEAPRDFDGDAEGILAMFENGELDDNEYQSALRELNKEESAYMARVAVWQDRQERAKAAEEDSFNAAALQFQQDHAAFLANPLHVDSMNRALEIVSQQNPGMAPADLIVKAAQATFEAYNYTPPTTADAKADADKVAKAMAARKPAAGAVPPSLRNAPAAASLDPSRSSYGQLDDLDISELEDAVARLPESKIQEFLRDAPGAASRGS